MAQFEIEGIIPPMVTPFFQSGGVDESAFRADAHYLVNEAKVHGLAVGGSTGEGHTLTTDEMRKLNAWAVDEVQGRVPIIAGIITNSTASAIKRGKAVADLGVAALQVTPVHYVYQPDEDALQRFFAEIAQATGLPVIIYNVVPWCYLSPQLLARIVREVDGAIGVKQSAADMIALANLLELTGDKARILTAVDALLYPSFALGAHGAIAAILAAVPKWGVQLWDAVRNEDHATARTLHKRLLRLWNALSAPNVPANVRTAMVLQGRCAGHPRPPMPESTPEQRDRIQAALAD